MSYKVYVNEYTGISSIANDAAYYAIVALVNENVADYCKQHNAGESSYAADIAYVNKVLAQFAATRNVDELIQGLAEQDTYVREYYGYAVEELSSLYYMGEWA